MIVIMSKTGHSTARPTTARTHVALWVAQVALAAMFVFAGMIKLVVPADDLSDWYPLPVGFMRVIGAMELLGGLGLVLPGLSRIHTWLTPLAAAGLVIIMTGAVVTTLAIGGGAEALVPAALLALASWVAYARWRVAPLPSRRRRGAAPGAAGR